MFKRKPRLVFVHVGKCGGLTIEDALRQSPVVRRRFESWERVHLKRPAFDPLAHYLFVLRNPVDRLVSAWHWRLLKVVETRVQERRFPGEIDVLKKYGSLNAIAEQLFLDDRENEPVIREFNRVHHIPKGIAWHLQELIKVGEPDKFWVFTTESLDRELPEQLSVPAVKRINQNPGLTVEHSGLTPEARANLARWADDDFEVIEKLYQLGKLPSDKAERLLSGRVTG